MEGFPSTGLTESSIWFGSTVRLVRYEFQSLLSPPSFPVPERIALPLDELRALQYCREQISSFAE